MNTSKASSYSAHMGSNASYFFPNTRDPEKIFEPGVYARLRSMDGWNMNIQGQALRFKKSFVFDSDGAIEKFSSLAGKFLKTQTVFVLVLKIVNSDYVIVLMRASVSKDAPLVACEIGAELDRIYFSIATETAENAA